LVSEILKYGSFGKEKRVAVLVNSLGATTHMELAIIARHLNSFLESKGFTVERLFAGTFLSSLDMAGISISVLGLNDEWLRWLDADTTAPAWPNVGKQPPGKPQEKIVPAPCADGNPASGKLIRSAAGVKTKQAIEAACQALIGAERELTELDRITGDGDLGISMERAAKAVQAAVGLYPLEDVAATLKALGHTLRRELGGASGPLYGVLFLRCGRVLEDAGAITIEQWAEGIQQGCRAISELGGAKPGDRTMLDALDPFVKTVVNGIGSAQTARRGAKQKRNSADLAGAREPVVHEFLKREALHETVMAAVEAADRGVEATARMRPRLGRSAYLGDRVLGHPDPGARAMALWLRAASEAFFGP
jgi:dihydroxyacetone kinase